MMFLLQMNTFYIDTIYKNSIKCSLYKEHNFVFYI